MYIYNIGIVLKLKKKFKGLIKINEFQQNFVNKN